MNNDLETIGSYLEELAKNTKTKLPCKSCNEFIQPIYRKNANQVHIGAYCPMCNRYLKWVPKDSIRGHRVITNNNSKELF